MLKLSFIHVGPSHIPRVPNQSGAFKCSVPTIRSLASTPAHQWTPGLLSPAYLRCAVARQGSVVSSWLMVWMSGCILPYSLSFHPWVELPHFNHDLQFGLPAFKTSALNNALPDLLLTCVSVSPPSCSIIKFNVCLPGVFLLWFSGILWSNILVLVIPLPGAGLFGNSPACLPATAQRIHRKHSLWTLASGHLPGPLWLSSLHASLHLKNL